MAAGAILDELLALGPRATGSPGEAAAAAWAAGRMERAGLAVRREPFTASRRPYWLAARGIPAFLAILMLLAARWPSLGLAVLAGVVLLPLAVRASAPLFDRGTPLCSTNVEGRSRPWIAGAPTLVISAHLDAKTTLFPLRARIALLLLAVLCVAVLLGGWIAGSRTVVALAGIVGAASSFATALDRSRPTSPGALDDGSGLATLIALAEALPARVAGRINLVVLATGAEEIGMAGALRWVQDGAGGLDASRTAGVNLDILGTAGPVWLAGSGRPARSLGSAAAAALRVQGLHARKLPVLFGAGMDHQRLGRAFPAISLTQGPGPASRWVHRPTDARDKVDAAVLDRIVAAISDVAVRPS